MKLIFLEIVPHSVQEWNKSRGHKEPRIFLQQDIVLYERVCLINDCIRHVNYNAGVKPPTLRSDVRYRKDKLSDSCRVSIGENPSICPFLKNNGTRPLGASCPLFFRNGQIRGLSPI